MHNLFSSKSVRTYNEHPPFESKFLVFSIFINAYIETPRFLSIKSKSKIKKKKKRKTTSSPVSSQVNSSPSQGNVLEDRYIDNARIELHLASISRSTSFRCSRKSSRTWTPSSLRASADDDYVPRDDCQCTKEVPCGRGSHTRSASQRYTRRGKRIGKQEGRTV